jgi:hypothetical protein
MQALSGPVREESERLSASATAFSRLKLPPKKYKTKNEPQRVGLNCTCSFSSFCIAGIEALF